MRFLHLSAKLWAWVLCAHGPSSVQTHTHAYTQAHSIIYKKLPGPVRATATNTWIVETKSTISGQFRSKHTCFWVLVETAVLGVLKRRQALLDGYPHVCLRTQQIRRPVMTLKETWGKGTGISNEHSNFLVPRLQSSRKGFNHKSKWSQPENSLLYILNDY